jgi:5-methylcytosine-specific restriction endonuclease McrA
VRAQENARYRRRAAIKAAQKAAEVAANADRIAKDKAEREAAKAERKRQYMRRWRKENPQTQAAQGRVKKARRRGAPGKHTAADIQAIGDRQRWRCAWCSTPCRDDYHVDHIVPLARGGTNWPDNLCISCPPCNLRKKARLPHEWAAVNGKLL